MDKILVEVFLPAANKSFDVYIPLKMKFHEVTFLLANLASDLSNGLFDVSQDTTICYRETGEGININMSAEELSLNNGSKLLLI